MAVSEIAEMSVLRTRRVPGLVTVTFTARFWSDAAAKLRGDTPHFQEWTITHEWNKLLPNTDPDGLVQLANGSWVDRSTLTEAVNDDPATFTMVSIAGQLDAEIERTVKEYGDRMFPTRQGARHPRKGQDHRNRQLDGDKSVDAADDPDNLLRDRASIVGRVR